MIESPQVKLKNLFTPLNHEKITLKNRQPSAQNVCPKCVTSFEEAKPGI